MRVHLTNANKNTTFPDGVTEGFTLSAGRYGIVAAGTFGGTCAVKLQACYGFGVDDATPAWVDVPNSSQTATGQVLVDLPRGKYRWAAANIHSTTDLIAALIGG